jgi:hypothetical protein
MFTRCRPVRLGDNRLYQISAERTGKIDPFAVEALASDCYIHDQAQS